MSAPAAISGDFATYRHVQGRKVLQLVIEVPAESAAAVFAALGTPGAGEGIPVALARLAKPSAQEPPAERKRFTELPYAQQAAIRCGEIEFQRFLQEGYRSAYGNGPFASNADAAAGAVRTICAVESRKEIVRDSLAGSRWIEIESEYWAWQRGRR